MWVGQMLQGVRSHLAVADALHDGVRHGHDRGVVAHALEVLLAGLAYLLRLRVARHAPGALEPVVALGLRGGVVLEQLLQLARGQRVGHQLACRHTHQALSVTQRALSVTQRALSVTQRALSVTQRALLASRRKLTVTVTPPAVRAHGALQPLLRHLPLEDLSGARTHPRVSASHTPSQPKEGSVRTVSPTVSLKCVSLPSPPRCLPLSL
jgi:hypothetical protein